MTPRDKAEELVEKMSFDFDMCRGQNIKCALIAVDEILDEISCIHQLYEIEDSYIEYWKEVKNEIEKL